MMPRSRWFFVNFLCFFHVTLVLSNGVPKSKPASRACVIGAGYCGLATARFMKDYGVNFTVFEATKHVGGTWRFDPHVGTDEDGLPVFTSMYKDLRINIPRQTMEYTGFPFPEGSQTFPTGECFYKYLKLFAKQFDLYKYIQFRSLITSVEWMDDHWVVTYMKTDTKENYTEECDFLAIASGEFRVPSWPNYKDQDKFKGNLTHSHDYRDSERYRGRRVLVVGAGPSGFDMPLLLSNITSKFVHSHHRNIRPPAFKNYVKKPDVKMFTSNGVIFEDGSFEEVDDVIFCTGYNLSYPFLDEKSTGMVVSSKYILPLYQYMVNILHPSMVFVGTPKLLNTNIREAQAEYAAALAAGRFRLPSKEKMLKGWMSRVQSLLAINKTLAHVNHIEFGPMSGLKYFASLTKEAGIYQRPPVLTRIKNINQRLRMEDLLHYKDYDFEVLNDHSFKRWYNPRPGNPCPIED